MVVKLTTKQADALRVLLEGVTAGDTVEIYEGDDVTYDTAEGKSYEVTVGSRTFFRLTPSGHTYII
jgi:hypothetical protein